MCFNISSFINNKWVLETYYTMYNIVMKESDVCIKTKNMKEKKFQECEEEM